MVKKYVVKQVDKKPTDDKYQHYSDKQRYKAVALYKMTGNMQAVSRTLGIPSNTLFLWRKSKWWPQYEDDLLLEKRALTSTSLEKLAKTASEVTQDRLTNGDWVFQNGKLERKPISAQHAHRILVDSLKTVTQLEDHYESQKKIENDIQIQERLKLVMDQMVDFAKSKELRKVGDPNSIDVLEADLVEEESNDAVHEERETRLQKGVSLGETDDGRRAAE